MTPEQNEFWLEERLFERRIVLCRGVLDDARAGRVAAQLMALDALGDEAVEMQIDCECASLEAAWTLIDVVDLLGVPVHLTCSGRVEGAAVGLLTAAERRTAMPHARFRLRDPELAIAGRASELEALLAHHRARLERLHERVAEATRRPVADVARDFQAGLSLDAPGALRYRLVDDVAGNHRSVRPIRGPRRTQGTGPPRPGADGLGFKPGRAHEGP
jgi:ATP-dependent Clp protease, protease subunit